MRSLVVIPALLAIALASTAHAESCRKLAPMKLDAMPEAVQEKLKWCCGHDRIDVGTVTDWSHVSFTITLARAPHLALAILQDCGTVTRVTEPTASDRRHFSSQIVVRIDSYATLLRLLRLPAVTAVAPHVPRFRTMEEI